MRKVLGPFPALQAIQLPVGGIDDAVGMLRVMDAVHDALSAEGCQCNGAAKGKQRDDFWGADLSELVIRALPHEIRRTIDGVRTPVLIAIDLGTLRVEVDDNREVMAWLYDDFEV